MDPQSTGSQNILSWHGPTTPGPNNPSLASGIAPALPLQFKLFATLPGVVPVPPRLVGRFVVSVLFRAWQFPLSTEGIVRHPHTPRFSPCAGAALGAGQCPVGMAAGQLCKHIIYGIPAGNLKRKGGKKGQAKLQELHPSQAIP